MDIQSIINDCNNGEEMDGDRTGWLKLISRLLKSKMILSETRVGSRIQTRSLTYSSNRDDDDAPVVTYHLTLAALRKCACSHFIDYLLNKKFQNLDRSHQLFTLSYNHVKDNLLSYLRLKQELLKLVDDLNEVKHQFLYKKIEIPSRDEIVKEKGYCLLDTDEANRRPVNKKTMSLNRSICLLAHINICLLSASPHQMDKHESMNMIKRANNALYECKE